MTVVPLHVLCKWKAKSKKHSPSTKAFSHLCPFSENTTAPWVFERPLRQRFDLMMINMCHLACAHPDFASFVLLCRL